VLWGNITGAEAVQLYGNYKYVRWSKLSRKGGRGLKNTCARRDLKKTHIREKRVAIKGEKKLSKRGKTPKS